MGTATAEVSVVNPPFVELEKPYIFKPFLEIPTYSFYLGAPDIHGYAFVPNFAPRLGVSVGWQDTQLTVAFSLPIPKNEIDRRGESKQQSYILHTQISEHPVDFYYQSYKGFYAGNPLHELSFSKAERYTQFPKASANLIGFNFYHVFSNESYDPRAAFNYDRIANTDGGSWYIMPFINHLEINIGDEIIVGSEPDAIKTWPDIHKLSLLSLGSTIGYGQTWVLDSKDVTLSLQGSLGPAIQRQQAEDRFQNQEESYGLSGKGGIKASLAQNNQDQTWGTRIFTDVLYSRLGSKDLYSTVLTFQLFYGIRF